MWMIGVISNATLLAAYALVAFVIAWPLVRSGQLRTNRLGTATAGIFLAAAVTHALLLLLLVGPTFGLLEAQGEALRDAWGLPLAIINLVAAAVGVYYWSLRRSYGSMLHGATLFDDLRERERQALELNDSVLQGLVVARMALDLEQPQKAIEALDVAIDSASDMITDLLGDNQGFSDSLLRSAPALVAEDERRQAEENARMQGPGGQP